MKKNKILKTCAIVAAIVDAVAACSLDSCGYAALAVVVICTAWLMLFGYVNRDRLAR